MAKITIKSLQNKITELEAEIASLQAKITQKEVGNTPKQEAKLPGGKDNLVPGGRDFGALCSKIGFGLQGLPEQDKLWISRSVRVEHFGRKTVVYGNSMAFLKDIAFCANESGLKSLISDNKKITIW